MKKIINAATFPYSGSAAGSDKRSGRIKFGSQDDVMLYDGVFIHLTTAKCVLDTNTGELSTSLNFYIRANQPAIDDVLVSSFYSYTPDEFEELYGYIQSLSLDELISFIEDNGWH